MRLTDWLTWTRGHFNEWTHRATLEVAVRRDAVARAAEEWSAWERLHARLGAPQRRLREDG